MREKQVSMVDVGKDGRQSRGSRSHPRRGWPVVDGGGHAVPM